MRNKNRIILTFAVFMVLLFSIEGWAVDWKYIDKDSQNNVWTIDMASISYQSNDIVKVLIKTTYSKGKH